MYVFESINENTDVRDNIFNDEVNDVDVFSGMSGDISNDIVKDVNGIGFDANGNVLGADGKVVMEPSVLRQSIRDYYESLGGGGTDPNPADYSSINIDGFEYAINENGEAVDAEGKVFKSVDEVKAIIAEYGTSDPETIEEIVAAANQDLGLEFTDEEGNAIEFDLNTVDGMKARDQYIVNNLAVQMARESVQQVLQSDTDFESLYHYKQQHGSADGWTPATDYSKITLLDPSADGADAQYLDIITKAKVANGENPDDAKQFAQYLIDDGKGEEFAKKGLESLKASDAAKLEAARKASDDAATVEKERITKYWNGVNSIINSGKVNDIVIPAFIPVNQEDGSIRNVPRQALYEYMSKPVKDGLSQYQLQNQAMTAEDKIIDAYMKFTKYSHASLAKAKASDMKVKLIRKARQGSKGKSGQQGAGGKSAVDSVVL